MAARRRAQERDFNRRRRLILDKGFERAYYQKDTAFGECLLKWNVREGSQLERRQETLVRQRDIAAAHREQEKKRFVVLRDQATREPTLLLERLPSADQYSDYVNLSVPRFMRPMETRQSKVPEFATFSVFQAVKKRKRNPWEDAVKEDVQFRPTLCPCARLSRQDAEKLTTDWAHVTEMQSKSLGLLTDNRSAPARPARVGVNPLGLPSRLNSALNNLAKDLFDDIPTPSEVGSAAGSGSSLQDEEQPVFITQLATQRGQGDLFDLERERKKDDRTKERKEQLAHKQHVDQALISIYDLLDRSRPSGQPRLHAAHAGGRPHGGGATRVSTAASSSTLPADPRTACQTAESIRILLDSKRRVTRLRRRRPSGADSDASRPLLEVAGGPAGGPAEAEEA